MSEEQNQATQDNLGDVAGAKAPVIDFNEVRRQTAMLRAKKAAYRGAIRETLTVSPVVEIEFRNGRKFNLEYTLRTALEVEKDEQVGKNIARGELTQTDLDNMEVLVALIWHGLAANHGYDRPSKEEILDLISYRRIPYFQMMVSDALEAMLPDLSLITRLEMEMKEDPDLLPFLPTNGGTGSGPSGSEY
jgi:hypothetical protein